MLPCNLKVFITCIFITTIDTVESVAVPQRPGGHKL